MAAATSSALPAWSIRLAGELENSDQAARELTAGLTSEQFNWQPTPGAWSVGQCLEHLCITNEAYLPAIGDALTGKPILRVQEITPGWFGRWFLCSFVEPSEQTKRVSAPKKIVPSAKVELSVVDRFLRGNEATRQLIRRAADYNVNRIRFWNPFLPGLRFTTGTGLQLVSSHERRHLQQAERVKRSAGFPLA